MNFRTMTAAFALAIPLLVTQTANASGSHHGDRYYEVTITNITKGEIFTPLLVATHNKRLSVFSLGEPASNELEQLAEGGDTAPLTELLESAGALDVTSTGDVLPPGQSVTVQVKTNRWNDRVSVAAMLVPTNDAFVALNGVKGPRLYRKSNHLARAYDAGTELNDEMCVSIPGPPFICTGEGYNPEGGEGYVYTHSGIHGIADLPDYAHDWNNPVATITIKQVRHRD